MNTQFSIPEAGCQVAITFAFPSYVIGTATVNKTTITGRITNIEYNDGRAAHKEKVLGDIKSWTVHGSRGNQYVVVRTIQRWSCTCPGFQFRKSCRHIKELQDA